MDQATLIGKQARWKIATVQGLLETTAKVVAVRNCCGKPIVDLDNGSTAFLDVLEFVGESNAN